MKTARREFLANASLASACVSVTMNMSLPARALSRSVTLSSEHVTHGQTLTIVFDEHLADSRAFAVRSRAPCTRFVPLGHDVGMVWFERLMPLASSPGNTITGLTTAANAFLLTRLAYGLGCRVEQRAIETQAGSDTLVMWQLVAANASI